MGHSQPKRIQVPSVLSEVTTVQQAVIADVEAFGHGYDFQFAIRLALDEALANAIHHGNSGDVTKRVTVEYQVTADGARISVCDEGVGFNPCGVPDPTLPENLIKPNGRGIMLMRAYMSSVQYNDRGNCVQLFKRSEPGGNGTEG